MCCRLFRSSGRLPHTMTHTQCHYLNSWNIIIIYYLLICGSPTWPGLQTQSGWIWQTQNGWIKSHACGPRNMHEPVQPKTGALNFTLYRSLSQKFKAMLQIQKQSFVHGGIMHGRLEDHAGRFAHIKDRTCRIRRPRCRRTRISVSQWMASLHSAYSNMCSMVHGGIVHGRPCWKIRAWKTLLEELRMEDHAGRVAYGRSCWRMEDHAGRFAHG